MVDSPASKLKAPGKALQKSRGRTLRVWWVVMGMLSVAFCGWSGPVNEAPELLESFAIDRDQNLLLLPVSFLGQTNLFLLDTGTTVNVFDQIYREDLGTLLSQTKITGEKNLTLPMFEAVDAYCGRIPLKSTEPILCRDFTRLRQILDKPIYGVLGMSFASQYIFDIDFDRARLQVMARAPEGWCSMRYFRPIGYNPDGIPIVLAKAGGFEGFFLVDSGNLIAGSLASATFELLEREGQLSPAGTVPTETAGGVKILRRRRLSDFSIGSFHHTRLLVTEGTANSVGIGYLKRYHSILDFPNRMIYWEKGRLYDEPEEGDFSGLSLERIAGELIIFAVDPGTPADLAGLRAKDVILEISQQDARLVPMGTVHRLLNPRNQGTIRITVARKGVKQTLIMCLRSSDLACDP